MPVPLDTGSELVPLGQSSGGLKTTCDIIKTKGVRSVAQKMRELTMNTRMVFDYLKIT
jgi:hypothetical protein